MQNVIGYRGYAGEIHSLGVDYIVSGAKRIPGVDPRGSFVSPYTNWRADYERVKGWKDRFILVGHSYGVPAMFGLARLLGRQVDLAIAIDASRHAWMDIRLWGSGGNTKPGNVVKCVHYNQVGGVLGIVPFLSPVTISGAENLTIQNVSHKEIDTHPLVQSSSLDEIRRVIASQ